MAYSQLFLDYCNLHELKLTSLRKAVLFQLWHSEKPLKAYELLDKLKMTSENLKVATIYRALDYFVEEGLVHKLESIQSYTLCSKPAKHLPFEVFLVCNNCHQVDEVHDKSLEALIKNLALTNCFDLNEGTIELKGFCQNCLQK